MLVKTKGIVIKETPYSETSKILLILTNDYGLISVISKGCRTLKSKLRGVSQRLCYGELSINYKEKGLSTLMEINIINSYKNIINDFNKASYAFYILDIINQVLKENNDKEIYYLLESALNKINEGLNEKLITIIIELQLLKYLGVIINVDKCSICDNTKDIVTLSVNYGGFICKNCYKEGYIVSSKTLKLIRLFYYVDLNKVDKLEINDNKITIEIDNFINDYYDKYTGIYLKNKKSLDKFKQISKNID